MGNEARAAGNRVGLAVAHARGPAILVGVGLAFMAGVGAGVSVTARSSDAAVQGALVGAVAGIAGGFVGAAVGAWASRDVASRTIADARKAREEARRDATAGMFLQERRAAIVAVLTAGEAAAREAEQTALNVTPDDPPPRADILEDFRRAWLELILLAPDLTSGAGGPYGFAVATYTGAHADWAYRMRQVLKAGALPGGPAPREVTRAAKELEDARAAYLVAAMQHLGVTAYAQPNMKALLGNYTPEQPSPAATS